MTIQPAVRCAFGLVLVLVCFVCAAVAQTETATISGLITDDTGAVVPGAEVKLQSVDRGSAGSTTTNNAGIYVFASVHAGQYQLTVHKPGFKQVDFLGLIVNVQDHIEQNFRLQIGSVAESITVEAGALTVNTQDATVSTVVDRQFAENLPLNGRSFQTLIYLTPGVVATSANKYDGGQFSVNGQRPSANYWTVDGVSANIGTSANFSPGNGLGGTLGSFSVLGGTNSLVSVDALQEFRIQTSTYAPEFGRTPGGQISIITRSGTNQFHGTAFDYLRNDIFDANDWFADSAGLPKAKDRQNDFGGTFGGPILRDRTFFFFSYEGLRLRLPQTALTTVPDILARQNANPAIQPFLNAYPLPNGTDDPTTGIAQFNSSFSNAASLDAYSIRVDQKLGDKINLFARYNYSPSSLTERGQGSFEPMSDLTSTTIDTQTATIGMTWAISPATANDLRFNYSRTNADSRAYLDNFGGAVPLTSLPLPAPFTAKDAGFFFDIFTLQNEQLNVGHVAAHNLQRQINIVDNVSLQRGTHALKFGVDFRRLSPLYEPSGYYQNASFGDVPSAETGSLLFGLTESAQRTTLRLHNLGAFAQDTWRVLPRLTLTYGLRWDVDFSPSSSDGPNLPAVTGFNLRDLSTLALAPVGTQPFNTTYGNVAPRVGVAYQLSQNANWQTVLRGGFGLFYDLASSETGTLVGLSAYPFAAVNFFGGTFPLDSATAAPPPITPAELSSGALTAFDPHLKLPYTLEWNGALEQALGKWGAISASYIGAEGRRLIQTTDTFAPNPSFGSALLVTNAATSDYNALQLQYQRRLSGGLQALASYVWSHSIDTASAGSALGNASNALVPALNPSTNRGPSDFDIRNTLSAGVTYEIPAPHVNPFIRQILRGWSLEHILLVRSGSPVSPYESSFVELAKYSTQVRPDVMSGIPLYLYGRQYPGGKALNDTPGAVVGGCPDGSQSVGPFCPPPTNSSGIPLRQGSLGRNALRGFGATQWDFAVHRDFPVHESIKVQFRAEMFNVLNHPNFAPPQTGIGLANFGRATQMLGQSLSGLRSSGGGGLSSLYQIGGPRSIQLALKLLF
jgi:hypothetical protein